MQFQIDFFTVAYDFWDEAQRVAQSSLILAAKAGEAFLQAKEQTPHGQFEDKLKADGRIGLRKAQQCMQVAKGYPELLSGKAQTFALLDFSKAVMLLSAEDETKAIVQTKLEAGESVTVKEIEELKRLASEKDGEIERLKRVQQQLFQDKDEAVTKLIKERDREKTKRRQVESVTNASDRDAHNARLLAEREAEIERLKSLNASQAAQLEGGLGVVEMLDPKVVIQRDPETERQLAAMTAKFEEMKRLRDRAVQNMEAMHDASLEAQAKLNRMEKSLTKVESASAVIDVFIQQAMDLRAMAKPVAALIQDGTLTLDQAALTAFLELAERLQRLVDMQRNQQAVLQAA